MKPQITSYKVATLDYVVKETWDVPDGTIYKTEIDGHDFCILESHSEKSEKLALELNKT